MGVAQIVLATLTPMVYRLTVPGPRAHIRIVRPTLNALRVNFVILWLVDIVFLA